MLFKQRFILALSTIMGLFALGFTVFYGYKYHEWLQAYRRLTQWTVAHHSQLMHGPGGIFYDNGDRFGLLYHGWLSATVVCVLVILGVMVWSIFNRTRR